MSQQLFDLFWETLKDESQVMVGLRESSVHSEPMSAQIDGNNQEQLWIYLAKDNRVASGGKCMTQFVSKEHTIFACMSGQLVEESNKEIISKFWSNTVEAWFEGGQEDPNLKMMRLDLESVEIWSRDPSFAGVLKLAAGSKVDQDEIGDHTLVEFTKKI